jgi:hypothetical protein
VAHVARLDLDGVIDGRSTTPGEPPAYDDGLARRDDVVRGASGDDGARIRGGGLDRERGQDETCQRGGEREACSM